MKAASPGTRGVSRGYALALGGVVLAAAVVRMLPARGDFWLDEIWTWVSVSHLDSAAEIFTRLHHSNNNHLNSLFFYWIGERANWFVYRIPSLVAGIGSVLLAASLAGRRGRLDAFFAALLTGGCFALIHFSSEARGYSLAVFFALAASWFLERDLERPRWWSAGLFAACVVLGILSHLTYLFYYAGALAQSGWRLMRRRGERRSGSAQLLRLHALPALCLLWLYAVDLRFLRVGRGNPTDFSELFARSVGYSLGLPVIPELALPYLLVTAVIAGAGLWGLWREGDDRWILMLVAIFGAPLLVLGLMRPEVVAVRYFLIGIALLLWLASLLLADLYRAGGWRRCLCLAALAVFVSGNALHTLAFLEHGRGGYRAALLYMARHTDGPKVVVGSDHDFRNEMVLHFYERWLPEGKQLLYHRRGAWPRRGPEWLITHAGRRPEQPQQRIRDEFGNRYELAAEFDHAAISGFYWAVYRNVSAAGSSAEP